MNLQQLISIMRKYIEDTDGDNIHLYAIQCLKSLGNTMPIWTHNLISSFMHSVTVAHAEAASVSFVPIYSNAVLNPQDPITPQIKDRLSALNRLNNLTHSLAVIFSTVVHQQVEGIPLTLSSQAFNISKQMIMGCF